MACNTAKPPPRSVNQTGTGAWQGLDYGKHAPENVDLSTLVSTFHQCSNPHCPTQGAAAAFAYLTVQGSCVCACWPC
jgi:hypothetical protein